MGWQIFMRIILNDELQNFEEEIRFLNLVGLYLIEGELEQTLACHFFQVVSLLIRGCLCQLPLQSSFHVLWELLEIDDLLEEVLQCCFLVLRLSRRFRHVEAVEIFIYLELL